MRRSTFLVLLTLITVCILLLSLRHVVMPEEHIGDTLQPFEEAVLSHACEGSEQGGFTVQGVRLIRDLQEELAQHGYYLGTLDGCAGVRTQQAIYHYQVDSGLSATGAINAPTLTHLGISLPAWFMYRKGEISDMLDAQSLNRSRLAP